MTSETRAGRIIGVLMLAHLAAGLIVPYAILLPLTKPPAAFLGLAAGMPAQVRLNVLLLFVGGAIPVGISVVAWTVVRGRSKRLGLWLLVLVESSGRARADSSPLRPYSTVSSVQPA